MSARYAGLSTRTRGGVLWTVMMLVLVAATAVAASPLPAPVERTLGNGLRVVVFPETRHEMVQIQLRVPAGLTAEPAGEAGVAYMVAEMVRRGTTSRDPRAFASAIDLTGGTIGSSVARDYATLIGTFLARDFETGVELMSDAAIYPVFDADELRRVRSQGQRQLAQIQANHGSAADEHLWRTLFGSHPYARLPYGDPQVLANLDAGRVRTFWSERWRPDHAVLAIAGDITPERAFVVAEEWFGRWTGNSGAMVERATVAAPARTRIRIIDRPAERVELRIGTLGPARGAEEEFALLASGSLLGGAPARRTNGVRTLHGREVRAGYLPLDDAGLFTIGVSTPVDSAGAALRALTGMMAALGTPASAEDFTSVQRLMKNAFPLSLETLAARTSNWLAVDSRGKATEYFLRHGERVDALTPAAVASASRRWIDPQRSVIVAVGPAARLKAQLERYGDVEVVSPQGAAAAVEPPAKPATPAPTAAERLRGRTLVQKSVAAHGGLAKLKAIRDSRIQADLSLNVGSQELKGMMIQARLEPDRMVYITEVGGIGTRQTLVGPNAWQLSGADSVPRDMDAASVGALRAGFSSDLHHLLLLASDPKARVWARGTTPIGDLKALTVVVEHPSQTPRTLYLHPVRHQLIAFDHGEPGKSGMIARRKFSDFKTVDGILWPYREERLLNGETVMIVDIRDVRFNTGVPDDAFKKPVAGSGASR